MKIYQFPPGGRDLLDDSPRKVTPALVRSLLPAAAGDEELQARLQHALRTGYLGLSTEVGLLKHAAGC